ncbi:RNA helicase required for poly(A+) mRNA export [Rhizophlyctis rosea]|nr:RNA helicase required for poly(A+) mRNA export [Rhizophlyctis rosea]
MSQSDRIVNVAGPVSADAEALHHFITKTAPVEQFDVTRGQGNVVLKDVKDVGKVLDHFKTFRDKSIRLQPARSEQQLPVWNPEAPTESRNAQTASTSRSPHAVLQQLSVATQAAEPDTVGTSDDVDALERCDNESEVSVRDMRSDSRDRSVWSGGDSELGDTFSQRAPSTADDHKKAMLLVRTSELTQWQCFHVVVSFLLHNGGAYVIAYDQTEPAIIRLAHTIDARKTYESSDGCTVRLPSNVQDVKLRFVESEYATEFATQLLGIVTRMREAEAEAGDNYFTLPTNLTSISQFEDVPVRGDIIKGLHSMGFHHPSKLHRLALPIPLAHRTTNLIVQTHDETPKLVTFAIAVLSKINCSARVIQAVWVVPSDEAGQRVVDLLLDGVGKEVDVNAELLDDLDEYESGVEIVTKVVVGSAWKVLEMIRRGNISIENVRCCVFDGGDGVEEMLDLDADAGLWREVLELRRSAPANSQFIFSASSFTKRIGFFAKCFALEAHVVALCLDGLYDDEVDEHSGYGSGTCEDGVDEHRGYGSRRRAKGKGRLFEDSEAMVDAENEIEDPRHEVRAVMKQPSRIDRLLRPDTRDRQSILTNATYTQQRHDLDSHDSLDRDDRPPRGERDSGWSGLTGMNAADHLILDFRTNKKIADEVAIIASQRLRHKIARFTTHLMKRTQRGPVRGIAFKLRGGAGL